MSDAVSHQQCLIPEHRCLTTFLFFILSFWRASQTRKDCLIGRSGKMASTFYLTVVQAEERNKAESFVYGPGSVTTESAQMLPSVSSGLDTKPGWALWVGLAFSLILPLSSSAWLGECKQKGFTLLFVTPAVTSVKNEKQNVSNYCLPPWAKDGCFSLSLCVFVYLSC